MNGCHDSQADSYDKQVLADPGDYIRENYFGILDRVAELIPVGRSLRILDIGIGTGLLTERMPQKMDLYGIDISPKMMDKIREKGLPVQLKVGSFLDIPFPDSHFDRIVSTFAFHHLTPEEKEKAYAEMHRVLKPDGFIIIGDFMFESEAQADRLSQRFRSEGRTDMLEEFEEECFTYIDSATASLSRLGYNVCYERGSTLSWIIRATSTNSQKHDGRGDRT
ncbi:MAG: class I SAM-dependent methyltransferase [Bacillota bacterium]